MKKVLLSVLALLAFAGSGIAQNLPSYVPANGLVGWWPFNGNANDESGNNNNGTVNGATLTADRFGNNSSCYYFNRDNQNYISCQMNSLLPIGNQSRTICIWAKYSGKSIINAFHIANYGDLQFGKAFGIAIYFNDTTINTWNSYSFQNDLSSGLIADTNWHFIASSYHGQTGLRELFVDGQLLAFDSVQLQTVNSNLIFGADPILFFPNFFDGRIDDVALYNRTLTQQEITALYQGTNTTGNCPTFPASLAQGLVGYWPFCGNALDESGNNNHGTVNGATLTTDRFGNAGSAYGFDGQSSYIQVNHKNNLNAFPISVFAWIKAKNINGSRGIVCKYPFGGSSNGWSLHGNLSYLSGYYFNFPGGSELNFDVNFGNQALLMDTTSWHLVGIICDTDSSKIFIDNELVISKAYSGNGNQSSCTNTDNLYFGQIHMNSLTNFNGSLDDIAIWNRALTPQEIQQVYNQGICQTSITVTDTLLIHTGLTSYNPVAYGNTLKVWPNPGNTAITLDAGNLSSMQGWKYKVANGLGQTVVNETAISQQQTNISLSTWGGNGIYYLHLINPQGIAVEIKKIVLAP
jgi:hypothetical protein